MAAGHSPAGLHHCSCSGPQCVRRDSQQEDPGTDTGTTLFQSPTPPASPWEVSLELEYPAVTAFATWAVINLRECDVQKVLVGGNYRDLKPIYGE